MKKQLEILHEYTIAIREYWSNDFYITLSVLLQNMVFKGEIIDKAVSIIELMAKLNKEDHVISSVLSELQQMKIASDMDNLYENVKN